MEVQSLEPKRCYRALRARDPRFDGRFFTAVVSTGIFCRPTCPARTPKFDNCAFYPSAASAHAAGFRPCLRCRPEVAPGLAGWRGTANTVRRALALITEGALAEGSVDALAERLGVSSRHLRRLFDEQIGTSPSDVARAHRLLFAKKLLSETTLPVSEVAFAAGFGSVRRFNTVIKNTYGRAPRELRNGSLDPDPRIRLKLPFKPPYDWGAMLHYLRGRAIDGMEVVEGETYRRSFESGIVEISPGGDGFLWGALELADTHAMASIVGRLRRLFDLDADIVRIEQHLASSPLLSAVVARRPGLRVPGAWDGFETAIRAILGQQITVEAARQLAGKLVARYGTPLARPGAGLVCAFPRPEALLGNDVGTLGMPASRARTISALSEAVIADPDFLAPVSDLEGNLKRLQSLPGVGPWTAHYIAIRVLGETDAFPASDVGLLRGATKGGRRPAPEELAALAEAWRPWRAYAAQHLWMKDTDDDE